MLSNAFAALTFLCLCVAVSAIVALLILRRHPTVPATAPPLHAPLPPLGYLPLNPQPPGAPPTRSKDARVTRDRLRERGLEVQEQIAKQLAAQGMFLEEIARQLAAYNARARGFAPPLPDAATRKTDAIESFSLPVAPRIDITEKTPVPGSRAGTPPDRAKRDSAMPGYTADPQRNGVR